MANNRGGARPGAGAPAGKPRRPGAGRKLETWKIKNGDALAVWVGASVGNMGTVKIVSRTVLVLSLDDGTEIKLVR